MQFIGHIIVLHSAVVIKKCLLTWMPPNSYNASSPSNNLIKLTHYYETKQMSNDSQIIRVKKT